jgi:primary-amine oxidase
MVLWGVYDSGNYDYVIEYGFRDDGTIAFRAGATGYNNRNFQRAETDPTKTCKDPKACGNVAHVHDILWRVDIDIDGPPHNSVREEGHQTANVKAPQDNDQLFNFGHEGGIDWNPEQYSSVVIEDISKVNAFGNHPGYALHPLRFGNGRHTATVEEQSWALHDIWITQWHSAESTAWADSSQYPDKYLPAYVANTESIGDDDVVLWYAATAHHDPADEDREPTGRWGVTLVHFFGFELNPHNLFEANPLGKPLICDRVQGCAPCTSN